jgi:hypothetical protein
MSTPQPDRLAATLRQRQGEADDAWIARLREHFAQERRDEERRYAERWIDADRQP